MSKQLFNSSEKSNFILNMTEDGYSKLASFCLIFACCATSLTTSIPVVSRKALYGLTAVGLSIAGVLCMIIALIGAMKKYITKKQTIPLLALAVTFVFGLISMINGYDMNIGFYGYTGRDEGFLTIVYYICFFATAASIKREKAVSTILTGVICTGLLNSIVGIIQVFTGKISFYVIAQPHEFINSASGFAQSPLFLAMMLSVALIAAIVKIIGTKSKAERIFSIISACIFSFVIMFTYSLIGIVGLVLAVISAVVAVIALKAPKKGLLSLLTIIVPVGAAVGIVFAGVVGSITEYRLYDGYNLWKSDSYVRLSASGLPGDNVDVRNVGDVYYTLNRKAMDIISGAPLTGTGPDQVVFPQLYTYGDLDETAAIDEIIISNKGTFDRVYNEYLNTAASRGVVSAGALVVFLMAVLVIGYKGFKKQKTASSLGVLLIVGASAIIFLVGCSNTAFSPIFWTICGCTCAAVSEPVKKAVAKDEPEKSE